MLTGPSLFNRGGRHAELTPAGRLVLDEGRQLLAAAAALRTRARRRATGWEPRLGVMIDTRLAVEALFPLAGHLYRETRTHLHVHRHAGRNAMEALTTGRTDLVLGTPELPGAGKFRTRLIGYVETVLLARADHGLCRQPGPLTPQAVAGHILIATPDAPRDPRGDESTADDAPVLVLPDTESQLSALRSGLGVGYVPKHLAASDIQSGRLRELPLVHAIPPFPVYSVWRRDNRGKALEWFLSQLERDNPFRELLKDD